MNSPREPLTPSAIRQPICQCPRFPAPHNETQACKALDRPQSRFKPVKPKTTCCCDLDPESICWRCLDADHANCMQRKRK